MTNLNQTKLTHTRCFFLPLEGRVEDSSLLHMAEGCSNTLSGCQYLNWLLLCQLCGVSDLLAFTENWMVLSRDRRYAHLCVDQQGNMHPNNTHCSAWALCFLGFLKHAAAGDLDFYCVPLRTKSFGIEQAQPQFHLYFVVQNKPQGTFSLSMSGLFQQDYSIGFDTQRCWTWQE